MFDQHDEATNIVITSAHPGQDVELTCSLDKTTDRQIKGWLIDHTGPYGVNSLLNGILDGYSTDFGNSIIILNIMMNDSRNGTEYQCVIMTTDMMIQEESDTVFLLHVAGE